MKKALATVTLVCLMAIAATAQPRGGPQVRQPVQPPQQTQPPTNATPVQANLNLIIEQIQKAALSTNGDLGKLRIEKWKTDNDQRDQLQKMADSIQRNVTYAIPGLINDVENSRGSMSATFKLYHNITIVYEYLSSLTDAAGVLGKREEYQPLANDAAALDSARQNLSTYIEQTASQIESRKRSPVVPEGTAPETSSAALPGGGKTPKGVHIITEKNGTKRIVVDDDEHKKAVKTTKKKTSKPSTSKPSPSPTPSPK
ncbi:MAG TPA: hypothetical protein VFW31_17235 [Candidatus Angelobacter sp.]|nr:hypothetical protein [Candidatus Angelobacter sp.]